jgi:hypothetical protein
VCDIRTHGHELFVEAVAWSARLSYE